MKTYINIGDWKMLNDKHIKIYKDNKKEVERLHKKDKLNYYEIDFMLKYYGGKLE